ncbi:hypothetical protein TRAPUB_13840 [Trametes pubescens]|uniref:Uncharacterized protein n=1 Tax=Trametes pubescens TaxID=154538 RepID=A0A1M2VQ00_TRAPU|nr:hypothetical protein TRAPUB_13840 [Trametes pubescens]
MDAWVSSLATRLNFLNKEHRISVKNDLYALSARMQEVYSPKNATSDVLTLLDERIQEATEFLAMAESLMADCEALYDQRVSEKSLDVFERVRLRRSMPTIRKGIQKAQEHKETIQTIMTEWRVYFRLYSCETELSKFLAALHTHKLTKTAAEEIATPVFERIVEISAARDKIVSQSSAIGLQLEASWLTYGRGGVRERELRRVIRQYDALLDSAETEKATQVAVMKEAEALAGLACSPACIPGPDGSQIFFDRLRNAFTQFKHIHVVCDSMQAEL